MLENADRKKIAQFDRKSNFHVVDNFRFPIPNDPTFRKTHVDTIIDGEFVLDKEKDGSVSMDIAWYHVPNFT